MDRESYQSLAYWRRSRRHFLSHLGGLAALSTPFASFTNSLRANAEELRKQHATERDAALKPVSQNASKPICQKKKKYGTDLQ